MMEPIGDACFWKLLDSLGIRWTGNVKPYNCKLCEEGPGYQLSVDNLNKDMANLKVELQSLEDRKKVLLSEQRNNGKLILNNNDGEKLYLKNISEVDVKFSSLSANYASCKEKLRTAIQMVTKYGVHLKQYDTCRDGVLEVQERLTPGECLIYRDFVNQHNERGKKINNLVIVILFREFEGGPLIVHNISNICEYDNQGSCDAYFVADVFDFHLTSQAYGSGLFKKFHTIIISGDHGPHFSSSKTIFNESTFHAKFGKRIRVLSLCSYHAFNRCDAAGAAVKELAHAKEKQGLALVSSSDYVFAIRNCGQENAWSYDFETINRSLNVFDENGNTDVIGKVNGVKLSLTEMCELQYWYLDENGAETFEVGIVLARPVIGEPVNDKQNFYVISVAKDARTKGFCAACSNRIQRPVYHTGKCDIPDVPHGDGLFDGSLNLFATPDPLRLQGVQMSKRQTAASRLEEGRFPCRFEGCCFRFYKSASLSIINICVVKCMQMKRMQI